LVRIIGFCFYFLSSSCAIIRGVKRSARNLRIDILIICQGLPSRSAYRRIRAETFDIERSNGAIRLRHRRRQQRVYANAATCSDSAITGHVHLGFHFPFAKCHSSPLEITLKPQCF